MRSQLIHAKGFHELTVIEDREIQPTLPPTPPKKKLKILKHTFVSGGTSYHGLSTRIF